MLQAQISVVLPSSLSWGFNCTHIYAIVYNKRSSSSSSSSESSTTCISLLLFAFFLLSSACQLVLTPVTQIVLVSCAVECRCSWLGSTKPSRTSESSMSNAWFIPRTYELPIIKYKITPKEHKEHEIFWDHETCGRAATDGHSSRREVRACVRAYI